MKDRLANPPHGVGDKLESTGFIKPLCGLDKAQISFIDQVSKREALVLVLLGNRNNKAKIRFGEFFKGDLVTFLDSLRQFYFFVGGKKINFAYFLEVFVKRLTLPVRDLFANF